MVPSIRWMIHRDMAAVLDIERHSFASPWREEDFKNCLRQQNAIGMVAEYQERVVGYMIYTLHKRGYLVENFAVHPDYLRRGVGTAMVKRLVDKVDNITHFINTYGQTANKRSKIVFRVCEDNVNMHLFLKRLGFVAKKVLRGYYEEVNRDAYQFVYSCGVKNGSTPLNRVGDE